MKSLPKYTMHVYRIQHGAWSHKVMSVTCRHEGIELLVVTVENRELLAISCPTWETTTAYSNKQYRPDYMCHGDTGTLYVNSLGDSYPIMKLHCSKPNFTGSNETFASGVDRWCSGMCYIPEHYRCLILCVGSERLIRAISGDTGKELWVIKGEIDGLECHPWGLLYLEQHHRVLVCDGSKHRVLVLHPRDGSHLQAISFSSDVGGIYDLFFHNNRIVMHHKCNISYLAMTVSKRSIEK